LEEYCELIPQGYFNRKLTTTMKNELIAEINFPKKWTSLKKALMLKGFEVIDGNNGNQRYSIIYSKENSNEKHV